MTSRFYQQCLTVRESAKVTRVSVLGAGPVAAHLWRISAFDTEYLGGHAVGEDIASPPYVHAGEMITVQFGPVDGAGPVYLEALQDDEWRERQSREAERARAEKQDTDADAAIWWAGCPS